jgi:hypothetical protein
LRWLTHGGKDLKYDDMPNAVDYKVVAGLKAC